MLKSLTVALLLSIALTGCYRMPCEGEFCTTPTTNNPGITRHSDSFQPGVAY